MTTLLYIERLVPAFGLLINALRFRGLHCGLRVEIYGPGHLTYGARSSLGEGARVELAHASAVKIGDNVSISRFVHIVPDSGHSISIGARTTVQDNCRIYGDAVIGSRCIFAPNVFVSSGTHVFDAVPYRSIQEQEKLAPASAKPIKIFDDCWFGINSVLMPGVTIGRGCVVGANAVVTADLPPYSVAVGNPARVMRQRLSFSPKSRIDATEQTDAPYFYDGFDPSSVSRGDEFIANSDFILALHHQNPRAVRLCLAGESGEIGFAGRRQSLPKTRDVVEFVPDTDFPSLPFLHFHLDGRCRLRWAELV